MLDEAKKDFNAEKLRKYIEEQELLETAGAHDVIEEDADIATESVAELSKELEAGVGESKT